MDSVYLYCVGMFLKIFEYLCCWNNKFQQKNNSRKYIAGVQQGFCWRTVPNPEIILLAYICFTTGGQRGTPEALEDIAAGPVYCTPAVTEGSAGVQFVRQRYLLPLA